MPLRKTDLDPSTSVSTADEQAVPTTRPTVLLRIHQIVSAAKSAYRDQSMNRRHFHRIERAYGIDGRPSCRSHIYRPGGFGFVLAAVVWSREGVATAV